jgi:hypothetical protein
MFRCTTLESLAVLPQMIRALPRLPNFLRTHKGLVRRPLLRCPPWKLRGASEDR